MINVSGVNQYLLFVVGLMLVVVYCWMLTERVSSRIRNSKVWYLGWLGGLLLLSQGIKLMSPVINMLLDGRGVNDEQVVPYLLVGSILLCAIVYAFQMYRFRRLRKVNYATHFRRS